MAETPAEIGRNGFDEWCWRRGLDLRGTVEGLRSAAIAMGFDGEEIARRVPSIETVRLIRLPFTDPRRRVPGKDLAELIHAFTAGEVPPSAFYPEHLNTAPAAPSLAGQA